MIIDNCKVPFFLLTMLCIAAIPSCSSSTRTGQTTYDTVTTMSGLRYVEYEKGTGAKVEAGMDLKVQYAGYLADGTLFDTSLDSVGHLYTRNGKPFSSLPEGTDRSNYFNRGGYPFEPLEFVVGKAKVIRGWDEGLTTDMYVGGRRRLIIPSELGYGSSSNGAIPANATLIFDINVLSAQ